jgi:hypothetical protein
MEAEPLSNDNAADPEGNGMATVEVKADSNRSE